MSGSDPVETAIQVTVFGCTDPGQVRQRNEDNLLVADLSRPTAEGGFILQPDATPDASVGRFTLGPKGTILLVADGMGGAAGGEVASRLAVSWIYREMLTGWASHETDDPRRFVLHLEQAVQTANARIHEEAQADSRLRGMGTTATLAGILGNTVYLAQVGDSRAYLIRRGTIVQLTRDQSVVQELLDAGAISEEEAERSKHSNRILQALGGRPKVAVALTFHSLRRGDLLLLCSDGLSGPVAGSEIATVAKREEDPDALCRTLLRTANERGGKDNITVVAARLQGNGLDAPDSKPPTGPRRYEVTPLP